MSLALEGLRVIDLSQGISGPLCTMQLADLGADTIKFEPPSGDWLREIGPFHEPGGESELFLQLNRSKRGIAVDLKTDEGREIFGRLIEGTDILVEGYRPGVMQRLGFDYDSLAAQHPRLIYCSISGYGTQGPLARAPASEIDVQARTGLNRHLGGPDLPPVRFGVDLEATGAGMAGFQGIMTALYWRERSGQGQHVETSLFAAGINLVQWAITSEESRQLSVLTESPDVGFATADGPVMIRMQGVGDGWKQLLAAIKREDVLETPLFTDPRAFNLPDLAAAIKNDLAKVPYEDLRHLIQDDIGGNIMRMVDYKSLLSDIQVEILGAIHTMEGHQTAGSVTTLDVPWAFSQELAALRFPAPVLGQHTAEVLQELGYDMAAINALRHKEIIRLG